MQLFPKTYLHQAEMDTWLVHVTKGEPLVSVDETFSAYRGLGEAIAHSSPAVCHVLIDPQVDYLWSSVHRDLKAWHLCNTEITVKVGVSFMGEESQKKAKKKDDLLAELGLPPDTEGTWHVRGEDPNCDLGGAHYMPSLGYLEGKLGEVIDYAMEMDRFWGWGWGGDVLEVKPVKAKKVTAKSHPNMDALTQQKQELEEKLAEVKRKIGVEDGNQS